MAVDVHEVKGNYHELGAGDLTEIIDHLNSNHIPAHKVIVIGKDTDNNCYFAVYHS